MTLSADDEIDSAESSHGHWPSFRYGGFRWFWAGSFVSRTGSWVHNAAVPYAVFEMTHQPVWVGAAGFALLFPQMLLSIPGGHLADRYDRRIVLLSIHVPMLIVASLLSMLWISDALNPWSLLLLTATLSALIGLQAPATQTVASEIVPHSILPDAVHLNVVAYQAARALGPLLAGAILVKWGAGAAFAIDAASFAFALFALAMMHTTRAQVMKNDADELRLSMLQILAIPSVFVAVSLTATISFLGPPVMQLCTLLASETFHVSANGYGILLSSFGFGALGGAVALSLLAHRRSRSFTLAWSTICFGAALAIVGFGHSYLLGLVGMFIAGACSSISLGAVNAGLQKVTESKSRGRVVALYLIALYGGSAIGAFVQGWSAEHISPAIVVGVAGLTLLGVGLISKTGSRLRLLDG